MAAALSLWEGRGVPNETWRMDVDFEKAPRDDHRHQLPLPARSPRPLAALLRGLTLGPQAAADKAGLAAGTPVVEAGREAEVSDQ